MEVFVVKIAEHAAWYMELATGTEINIAQLRSFGSYCLDMQEAHMWGEGGNLDACLHNLVETYRTYPSSAMLSIVHSIYLHGLGYLGASDVRDIAEAEARAVKASLRLKPGEDVAGFHLWSHDLLGRVGAVKDINQIGTTSIVELSEERLTRLKAVNVIRIAFISSDFVDHPSADLIYFMINQLGEMREFQVHIFATQIQGVPINERFESIPNVHFTLLKPDYPVRRCAEIIASHGPHVAVFIGLGTAHAKCGIECFRVAPVQVAYLALPASVGSPYLDAEIFDCHSLPDDGVEYITAKQVVRWPITYLCNSFCKLHKSIALNQQPLTRAMVGLPADPNCFVFCVGCRMDRVVPRLLGIIARVLARVKRAVIWFYCTSRVGRHRIIMALVALGVDKARIFFFYHMNDKTMHLARLALADVAFDTFGYGAHTTGVDFMWSGVPLIAYKGSTIATRVAYSMMKTLEVPELIFEDDEQCYNIAVKLATDSNFHYKMQSAIAGTKGFTAFFKGGHALLFKATVERLWDNFVNKRVQRIIDIKIGYSTLRSDTDLTRHYGSWIMHMSKVHLRREIMGLPFVAPDRVLRRLLSFANVYVSGPDEETDMLRFSLSRLLLQVESFKPGVNPNNEDFEQIMTDAGLKRLLSFPRAMFSNIRVVPIAVEEPAAQPTIQGQVQEQVRGIGAGTGDSLNHTAEADVAATAAANAERMEEDSAAAAAEVAAERAEEDSAAAANAEAAVERMEENTAAAASTMPSERASAASTAEAPALDSTASSNAGMIAEIADNNRMNDTHPSNDEGAFNQDRMSGLYSLYTNPLGLLDYHDSGSNCLDALFDVDNGQSVDNTTSSEFSFADATGISDNRGTAQLSGSGDLFEGSSQYTTQYAPYSSSINASVTLINAANHERVADALQATIPIAQPHSACASSFSSARRRNNLQKRVAGSDATPSMVDVLLNRSNRRMGSLDLRRMVAGISDEQFQSLEMANAARARQANSQRMLNQQMWNQNNFNRDASNRNLNATTRRSIANQPIAVPPLALPSLCFPPALPLPSSGAQTMQPAPPMQTAALSGGYWGALRTQVQIEQVQLNNSSSTTATAESARQQSSDETSTQQGHGSNRRIQKPTQIYAMAASGNRRDRQQKTTKKQPVRRRTAKTQAHFRIAGYRQRMQSNSQRSEESDDNDPDFDANEEEEEEIDEEEEVETDNHSSDESFEAPGSRKRGRTNGRGEGAGRRGRSAGNVQDSRRANNNGAVIV